MIKKLKTKGMHCRSCEKIIERAAAAIDGVASAKSDYEKEELTVEFDDDKTDVDEITKAVNSKGYDCHCTSVEPEEQPEEQAIVEQAEHHPDKEDATATSQLEEGPTSESHPNQEGTITINKLTVWKSLTVISVILLMLSVFTGGFGFGSNQGSQPVQAAQPAQPKQAAPIANQPTALSDTNDLIDDDDIKGDKNAPVTIIEWSDFECPFCTRFYTQTLGQIDEQYIKTGKVKFVYRDYPLNFHKNAQKAAEAAECAGEQNKYYEMHDKLFEEGVSGGVESFKKYAKDIGLNAAAFNDCLDSGKMAPEIAKDFQDGQNAGITGTPGFIINGKLVVGAQPFDNFKQIIEEELRK